MWILLMSALKAYINFNFYFFNSRENVSKNKKVNVCPKGTH